MIFVSKYISLKLNEEVLTILEKIFSDLPYKRKIITPLENVKELADFLEIHLRLRLGRCLQGCSPIFNLSRYQDLGRANRTCVHG